MEGCSQIFLLRGIRRVPRWSRVLLGIGGYIFPFGKDMREYCEGALRRHGADELIPVDLGDNICNIYL